MRVHRHLVALAATAGALIAAALPQAASASNSVVNFDGPPAVVGQSANTIYATSPGEFALRVQGVAGTSDTSWSGFEEGAQ